MLHGSVVEPVDQEIMASWQELILHCRNGQQHTQSRGHRDFAQLVLLVRPPWKFMETKVFLAPDQSPLSSFLYHSKFQMAVQISVFSIWKTLDLDKFGLLGNASGMFTVHQLADQLSGLPNWEYQFKRVKHLIDFIHRMCNCCAFQSSTLFEVCTKYIICC